MTHQNAIEQMAVEHYLLGELTGEARARFEEHLFDCQECTADLKQGVLFLEGAKVELKNSHRSKITASNPTRFTSPGAWLWQARFLAPALAACLAIIIYQSAVLLPGLRAEIAESQTPTVLAPLTLANAGARGDAVTEIRVPRHGFYALSVDIPPATNAVSYRCSLYSPAGALLWHVDVSPQQAHDAVTIQVPSSTTQEGMNELRVQSVQPAQDVTKDSLVLLASYRYKVSFGK
jgi:hypothetical protein